jgi:hypothetical protein
VQSCETGNPQVPDKSDYDFPSTIFVWTGIWIALKMAIIDHIRGLEVTVEIGGATAKEYDPPDEQDSCPPPDLEFHIPAKVSNGQAQQSPYMVKYIEAQPDVRFNFHIKRLPNFKHCGDHIAARVQVDSMRLRATHDNTVTPFNKHTTWSRQIASWAAFDETNGHQSCYFRFAKLDIDSEGHVSAKEVKQRLDQVKTFGVLRTYLYHMKSSGMKNASYVAPTLPSLNKIPEKCLKGRAVDTAAR